MVLALLLATTFSTARAASVAPDSVAVCVDRYLARLKPANDIATIATYGGTCAELIREQNASDYAAAANAVLVNQRYNTNVLLWMVVLITLAGTALAGVQLYWSYQLALTGKGQLADGSGLEVSRTSIAVRSSVVGVIILGLSLIFFIVFVWKVYPITLLGGDTASVADDQIGGIVGPESETPLASAGHTNPNTMNSKPVGAAIAP